MLNTIPKPGQHKSNITKWKDGKPTVMYARSGYGWVTQPDGSSVYMRVKPGGTGITLKHGGMSRRERRWWEKTRKGQRRMRYLQNQED